LYFRAGYMYQQANPGNVDMDLPLGNAAASDSGFEMVDEQIPVAAIVGYALPVLNRRLSVETIIGFPLKTHFRATGALATESLAPMISGVPTGIPALGAEIGDASVAGLILTAAYRLPDVGPVTPMVGTGGMLFFAYDERITNRVLSSAGQPTLTIEPAAGLVLQAGAEARVWRNVFARVDAKYVVGMTVESRIDHIKIPAPLLPAGAIDVGSATTRAEVAPLIIQAGIGADF
jgi:outer membrane protein W